MEEIIAKSKMHKVRGSEKCMRVCLLLGMCELGM
jgi:hypothetical protein